MKNLVTGLAISALTLSCASTESRSQAEQIQPKIKNVIMIVADGMGPAYTTAYRYYADDPKTTIIEPSIFDQYIVGTASTYPAHVSGYVTDSAAAATALSSGIKTYNEAVGVDVNKNPVETVLQRAKKLGKKTAVVVTSRVNHATPASYITHNEYRRNYNEIADSFVDNGINTDVLLGAGSHYFIRKDRNLVKSYENAGFQYIDKYEQLHSVNKNAPLLGLFAPKDLPPALDDSNAFRLSMMTKAAIEHVENDNGFFMLIEASQVDWAGHDNDVNSAMAEMDDLAKTIELLEQYVTKHPDTQVILTADHSTGGFTIGANGVYQWRPAILHRINESTSSIAQYFTDNIISKESLQAKLGGAELTSAQVESVETAKQNAVKALAKYMSLDKQAQKGKRKPSVQWAINKAINHVVAQLTNTGWTSTGHTAIDVPVFAIGSASSQFTGLQDNTDIAKKIFKLLEQ